MWRTTPDRGYYDLWRHLVHWGLEQGLTVPKDNPWSAKFAAIAEAWVVVWREAASPMKVYFSNRVEEAGRTLWPGRCQNPLAFPFATECIVVQGPAWSAYLSMSSLEGVRRLGQRRVPLSPLVSWRQALARCWASPTPQASLSARLLALVHRRGFARALSGIRVRVHRPLSRGRPRGAAASCSSRSALPPSSTANLVYRPEMVLGWEGGQEEGCSPRYGAALVKSTARATSRRARAISARSRPWREKRRLSLRLSPTAQPLRGGNPAAAYLRVSPL